MLMTFQVQMALAWQINWRDRQATMVAGYMNKWFLAVATSLVFTRTGHFK